MFSQVKPQDPILQKTPQNGTRDIPISLVSSALSAPDAFLARERTAAACSEFVTTGSFFGIFTFAATFYAVQLSLRGRYG